MTTKPPASIGDALIFMTKALVVIGVLIVGTIGLFIWNDDRARRADLALRNAHAEVLTLGDKLNECLVAGAVRDLDNASLNDLRAELKERASTIVETICRPGGMREPEGSFCKEMAALSGWEWSPTDPFPPPGFEPVPAGEP
jgi:hypothetical protein